MTYGTSEVNLPATTDWYIKVEPNEETRTDRIMFFSNSLTLYSFLNLHLWHMGMVMVMVMVMEIGMALGMGMVELGMALLV